MARVQLRNLEKVYGGAVKAVHGINLDIKDGEFMVFVGPSGCAKSTTLRMVAGLEEITGGEIVIGDLETAGHVIGDAAHADKACILLKLWPVVQCNLEDAERFIGVIVSEMEADQIKRGAAADGR